MAPHDQSPRGQDRRSHNDRRDTRDNRESRDSRPRRDRSASRDRGAPRGPRGDTHRDTRHRSRSPARAPRDSHPPRQRSPVRPARGGGAPPPPSRNAPRNNTAQPAAAPKAPVKVDEAPTDESEEAQMQRLMGFGTFKTTKNTKVPGNDKLYAVRKDKQTEYRQYMNRVGGFNRPLSPSRM